MNKPAISSSTIQLLTLSATEEMQRFSAIEIATNNRYGTALAESLTRMGFSVVRGSTPNPTLNPAATICLAPSPQHFATISSLKEPVAFGAPLLGRPVVSEWSALADYARRGSPREWLSQQPPPTSEESSNTVAIPALGSGKRVMLSFSPNHLAAIRLATMDAVHAMFLPPPPQVTGTATSSAHVSPEHLSPEFTALALKAPAIVVLGDLLPHHRQLSVLAALERSELPIICLTTTAEGSPEYRQLLSSVKRAGAVHILQNPSPTQRAAVVRAARVVVALDQNGPAQPDLLQAASLGKNLVVSKDSANAALLGPDCFAVHGHELAALENAIIAAYYSPVRTGPREIVLGFTASRFDVAVRALLHSLEIALPQAESRSAEAAPTQLRAQIVQESTTSASVSSKPAAPRKQLPELVQQINAAMAKGERATAIALLAEAELFGQDVLALRRTRAIVQIQDGRISDAKTTLLQVLALDSTDVSSHWLLGQIAEAENNLTDAHQSYIRALAIEPLNRAALLRLCHTATQLSRKEDVTWYGKNFLQRSAQSGSADAEVVATLSKLGVPLH